MRLFRLGRVARQDGVEIIAVNPALVFSFVLVAVIILLLISW
jgi:hypothetical protein